MFHIVSNDIRDNCERGDEPSLCQLLVVGLVCSCNVGGATKFLGTEKSKQKRRGDNIPPPAEFLHLNLQQQHQVGRGQPCLGRSGGEAFWSLRIITCRLDDPPHWVGLVDHRRESPTPFLQRWIRLCKTRIARSREGTFGSNSFRPATIWTELWHYSKLYNQNNDWHIMTTFVLVHHN